VRVGVLAGRLYRRGDLSNHCARQPAPLTGQLSPQGGRRRLVVGSFGPIHHVVHRDRTGNQTLDAPGP
jgi:hypothetical protein